MFDKVLIANRGEIACRIARTLRKLGIGSVAVYSEADAGSLHVSACDESVLIGPPQPASSYLDVTRILDAARATGARAIHPGYGFLSENAAFAEACEAAGIAFIGPTPAQMRDFGLKHTARALAEKSGVPLLPGTGLLTDVADAIAQANRIGYPVMLKSTAGGGGIGMQAVADGAQLAAAWETVSRLSQSNFKHGGLYLEKYVARARHVEVQVFGDGKGKVLALGERDCSAQRRNQKVLEETPAPGLSASLRSALHEAAVRLCRSVAYRGAGTVEFVLDADKEGFYFLEVNTRLQVEHGVTEEVTGIDLVAWMIKLAAGELGDLERLRPAPSGASIQARVYAENPRLDFRPSSGLLTEVEFPPDTRVDTWVERGSEISPFYDPLLAKIIARGENRAEALANLRRALAETRLGGIETNLEFLRAVAASPLFAEGRMTTRALAGFAYASDTLDVLTPGAQTTVQDYPGRIGHWDVGVPPSGPFDPLAFRLANRLAGNPAEAAGLEITVAGPSLRFNRASEAVVTGALLSCSLVVDGVENEIPMWTCFGIPAGATLKLGAISGSGMRAYLAVAGGIACPQYLGSRSTFTLGNFGGHGGRALRAGDVLPLGTVAPEAFGAAPDQGLTAAAPVSLPPSLRPSIPRAWDIGVLYGPHGAPDYFTPGDIDMFFATAWEVHYNSNRTGVRLVGPKPEWARADGGEAGLHPSNIHDNAYAIGAVDFTGDMPILLGPDGPSLGGFVCPATLVQAELWKMGQLKPGDTVRFRRLSLDQARALERAQEALIAEAVPGPSGSTPAQAQKSPSESGVFAFPATAFGPERCILHEIPARGSLPEVRYRRSGDRNLLVEYGAPVLDLALRFRVHVLMEHVQSLELAGVLDLTPGIRSLQIHFDGRRLPMENLLRILVESESDLPDPEEMEIPSRTVHMPLSWDDEATHAVIRKYMQSVRADAPWCPSNIEFIRRINGLEDTEAVRRVMFDAEFLVLGLGDVYLGAPVATPLDPRHRMVTTKYNPARTWTVDNVVGIGGAYMCIYGMEGPGGYQLFGRTCQVWNAWRQTREFTDGKPWLLRFFDRIRFYPVSGAELLEFRAKFLRGQAELRIEEGSFRLSEYDRFLKDNGASIAAFRETQRRAFGEERERWKAAGPAVDSASAQGNLDVTQDQTGIPVDAQISGSVWKVLVSPGETVAADAPLLVLESMKMEFTVTSPVAGKVKTVLAKEGLLVTAGQTLVYLES